MNMFLLLHKGNARCWETVTTAPVIATLVPIMTGTYCPSSTPFAAT